MDDTFRRARILGIIFAVTGTVESYIFFSDLMPYPWRFAVLLSWILLSLVLFTNEAKSASSLGPEERKQWGEELQKSVKIALIPLVTIVVILSLFKVWAR